MSNNLDFNDIKQKAIGRWVGIYQSLGIAIPCKKHGPCPVCGGKDRFRMDDKDGKGTYFCNQHGAGDGFKLVSEVLKCDVKEAFESVARIIDVVPLNPITQEKPISPEILRKVFKESYPVKKNDPVHKYLKNRGLLELPETLRYSPKCWEPDTRKEYPAMLSIFRLPDGEAITMNRIYIKDGKKLDIDHPKKIMPALKKMNGGAVRLYEGKSEVIGVCEGIETAIAIHQMYGVVMWACLTAELLESFEPPEWVDTVRIYSDNDYTYTGQKASFILANRLVVQKKIRADVFIAKTNDFLEDLNMGIK